MQRRGCLAGLLHRNERLEVGVHVDLLLDGGKFDELLGKLIGVEWVQRILILQLGGQKLQKGIEIAGELLRCVGTRGPAVDELEELELDEVELASCAIADVPVLIAWEAVLMALVLHHTFAAQTRISIPLPSPARV